MSNNDESLAFPNSSDSSKIPVYKDNYAVLFALSRTEFDLLSESYNVPPTLHTQ